MAALHMQLDLPVPKGPLGPSNSTICPRTAPKRPPKPQNFCTLAAHSPKPKTDHILGYVAQNAISSASNPPATTHFWWFPPLKIAISDTPLAQRGRVGGLRGQCNEALSALMILTKKKRTTIRTGCDRIGMKMHMHTWMQMKCGGIIAHSEHWGMGRWPAGGK